MSGRRPWGVCRCCGYSKVGIVDGQVCGVCVERGITAAEAVRAGMPRAACADCGAGLDFEGEICACQARRYRIATATRLRRLAVEARQRAGAADYDVGLLSGAEARRMAERRRLDPSAMRRSTLSAAQARAVLEDSRRLGELLARQCEDL